MFIKAHMLLEHDYILTSRGCAIQVGFVEQRGRTTIVVPAKRPTTSIIYASDQNVRIADPTRGHAHL